MKRGRFTGEQIIGVLKKHLAGLGVAELCRKHGSEADMPHPRELIATWRDDYNHHRPHTSLDGLTPRDFLNRSVKDQTTNRTNL
jgi:transposase InsO family protein